PAARRKDAPPETSAGTRMSRKAGQASTRAAGSPASGPLAVEPARRRHGPGAPSRTSRTRSALGRAAVPESTTQRSLFRLQVIGRNLLRSSSQASPSTARAGGGRQPRFFGPAPGAAARGGPPP